MYNDKNILDIVVVLIYVIIIVFLSNKFKVNNKIQRLAYLIGILHFVMAFVFYWYSLNHDADARGYYLSSLSPNSWVNFASTGTALIGQLIHPFTYYFGLSYLSSNLMISIISLLGVYKLYHISLSVSNYKWTNWFYIFLLPSVHFWTGFLGKDAIVFFAITYLLHNYYFKKDKIYYILPVLILGLVRFYILAFIGIGVIISGVLLTKQLKLVYKILIGIVGVISIIYISPYFFDTVGVDGVEGIEKQREIILNANLIGAGGVDLSDSNMAIRIISYLFRPFLFEANSFTKLMASVENILWLVIFYKIFKNVRFKQGNLSFIFWGSLACIFTIMLPAAFILSNLGIAARQKIMLIPFLYFVFFTLIALQNSPRKSIQTI